MAPHAWWQCFAPSHVTCHCSYTEVEWFINSAIGSLYLFPSLLFAFSLLLIQQIFTSNKRKSSFGFPLSCLHVKKICKKEKQFDENPTVDSSYTYSAKYTTRNYLFCYTDRIMERRQKQTNRNMVIKFRVYLKGTKWNLYLC